MKKAKKERRTKLGTRATMALVASYAKVLQADKCVDRAQLAANGTEENSPENDRLAVIRRRRDMRAFRHSRRVIATWGSTRRY